MKNIQEAQIKEKNVLIRIDSDVPIEKGVVLDDKRLQSSIPTLKFLLENEAQVTIIGHIDRPGGKEIEDFKMRPVEDRLTELLGTHQNWQILENLRFDIREEKNDSEFAQQLAAGQDIFVQDAFAVCHRAHASTVGVAKILPSFAGFSVQREVENLTELVKNPEKPFIVIVGGAKIEDKKPVINGLLDKADKILTGGVVGNVLQNEKEKLASKIVLPLDGVPNLIGFDIGPKTIEIFKNEIAHAKTIFWAGPMGKYEEPEYATGTKKIAQAIIDSSAKKYAGGGDTVAFISKMNLDSKFDFISVGGGATLEFLAGKELPGLTVLETS